MDNTNNVVDYNRFVECEEYLRRNYASEYTVPGIAFCRELMHKTIENDHEIPMRFTVSHFYSNSHESIRLVMERLTHGAVNHVDFYAHGKKHDYILCECSKKTLP